MKKIRLFTLLALPACCLTACGGTAYTPEPDFKASDVKVGLICLHGDYSTYDANFISAMNEAKKELGFSLQVVENIEEGQPCYDKAAEMAELGCNVIFADSFGHEPYMIEAAKANDYEAIIIADHGNADNAINPDGTPNTAHSLNPVPFIYVTENNSAVVKDGRLADVAPSLLHIMGLEQPGDMTGECLIIDKP